MQSPHVVVISTAPAALERAAAALPHVQLLASQEQAARLLPCQVTAIAGVSEACRKLRHTTADAVVLLLRDTTPAHCLDACARVQEALGGLDVPLAVIFPSTDPAVWQQVYASGANMFLPWHGNVLEGLPTYVGSLLGSWRGPRSLVGAQPRILLDEKHCRAVIQDWRAEFTPVQFRILKHLVRNKGRLVSKEELTEVLRRPAFPDEESGHSSLYQHISQIRKRLGPHARILRCIRRRGYMLDPTLLAA